MKLNDQSLDWLFKLCSILIHGRQVRFYMNDNNGTINEGYVTGYPEVIGNDIAVRITSGYDGSVMLSGVKKIVLLNLTETETIICEEVKNG